MKALRIIEWDHHDGGQSIKNIVEMRFIDIFKKKGAGAGFWRIFTDLVDSACEQDVHITLSVVDYKKGETK